MIFEYATAMLLVVLLVLIGNPFMFWMPSMLTTSVLLVIAVLVLVYAGFILKENGGDEREMLHRMLASRAAYLAGIAALTVALLVQGLVYQIDPWIAGTLALMIVVKVATRTWADKER